MRKLYMAILLGFVIFSSCGTNNAVIRDEDMKNLPTSTMMERAIANYVNYDFKSAIAYYQAIIKYYPDDYDNVAWANYEIGFMHWKDNRYKKAKVNFLAVLDVTASSEAPKILAKKMLIKIKDKLEKKTVVKKTKKEKPTDKDLDKRPERKDKKDKKGDRPARSR